MDKAGHFPQHIYYTWDACISLCMEKTLSREASYLLGLQAEAIAGLWTGNLSAGSDKVAPTPDRRAVKDHQNISLEAI